MALGFLRNPYLLAGAGGIALLGATIYQHANNVAKDTGFHFKDPDPTLRIVEKDVVIPKYMVENAQKVKCRSQALAFQKCVEKTEPNSWARLMTFKTCKRLSNEMMECMDQYFKDYSYYLEIKGMYINDKALFQQSKVMKKERTKIKDMVLNSGDPTGLLSHKARQYYSAVKEEYEKTQNIDAFDDILIAKYKAKLPTASTNQV